SGLIWSLIAPPLPTNTSWPLEISVRKVKVTSATGVTLAGLAAMAWGTKPTAPAKANNNTRFFIRVFLPVTKNRSLDATLGSGWRLLHDLGQARPDAPVLVPET